MRKLFSGAIATTLAASFAIASAMPLQAAPVYVPKSVSAPAANTGGGNVEQVQYRWRRGPGFYRGYRGYRGPRAGYRYYNGWWFPAGAFIAGAVIGSALAEPPIRYKPRNYGNAHVEWCYNRYKSYRAYDNTFQPYNGPRQQCYSPYS